MAQIRLLEIELIQKSLHDELAEFVRRRLQAGR